MCFYHVKGGGQLTAQLLAVVRASMKDVVVVFFF